MSNTQYDCDKLFLAYEEARADITAHFRKIVELQKEIERLKEECSSMGKLLQSGIVISYEEHDEFMKIKSLKSELAEKDVVLNTAKNDYWFMSCLLERTTNDKYLRDAVNNCIERMKFRKPMFEVLQKYRKSEW